jgi:type I restriction enzyme R subunit
MVSALARAMIALLKVDTELFKYYSDNEDFKKWRSDSMFTVTYEEPEVA